MTTTHEELKYLTGSKIFGYSEESTSAVLQLTTEDQEFRCLVTPEMFLKLAASFRKHGEKLSKS